VAIGLWECQSGLLLYFYCNKGNLDLGGEVPTAGLICGRRPVDVKVKMHGAAKFGGENQNEAAKSRRNRVESMIDRESAWCLLTEFKSQPEAQQQPDTGV